MVYLLYQYIYIYIYIYTNIIILANIFYNHDYISYPVDIAINAYVQWTLSIGIYGHGHII